MRYINHIASKGKKTAKLKLNLNKEVDFYHDVELSNQTWDRVFNGLFDVVNSDGGSGWRARQNSDIKLFGKTSTAENPHGDPHAWFNGFFELNNQKFSIVVLVENGGGGGAVASPIAGKIVSFITKNSVEIVSKVVQ